MKGAVRKAGLVPVVAALLLAAAGGVAALDAGEEEVALARARELTAELAGRLMPRLQAEIAERGTAGALEVCAEIAQPMTVEAARGGATLRRVSLRPRNPADRPDALERRVLEQLQVEHAAGALPAERHEIVDGPAGRELRYFKPVVVQPLCLRCHGDAASFDPEVRARLAELYPQDEAVGYAVGDLRGAVSVRVPLATSVGD